MKKNKGKKIPNDYDALCYWTSEHTQKKLAEKKKTSREEQAMTNQPYETLDNADHSDGTDYTPSKPPKTQKSM